MLILMWRNDTCKTYVHYDLHPYDSGSEDVTVEELYEGLLQTVMIAICHDARYSLDRGRRTARLTHRIGDYASRHA